MDKRINKALTFLILLEGSMGGYTLIHVLSYSKRDKLATGEVALKEFLSVVWNNDILNLYFFLT